MGKQICWTTSFIPKYFKYCSCSTSSSKQAWQGFLDGLGRILRWFWVCSWNVGMFLQSTGPGNSSSRKHRFLDAPGKFLESMGNMLVRQTNAQDTLRKSLESRKENRTFLESIGRNPYKARKENFQKALGKFLSSLRRILDNSLKVKGKFLEITVGIPWKHLEIS